MPRAFLEDLRWAVRNLLRLAVRRDFSWGIALDFFSFTGGFELFFAEHPLTSFDVRRDGKYLGHD